MFLKFQTEAFFDSPSSFRYCYDLCCKLHALFNSLLLLLISVHVYDLNVGAESTQFLEQNDLSETEKLERPMECCLLAAIILFDSLLRFEFQINDLIDHLSINCHISFFFRKNITWHLTHVVVKIEQRLQASFRNGGKKIKYLFLLILHQNFIWMS